MEASIDTRIGIDFETFGVELYGELLRRAYKISSDLSAFGDLELRSAWLYFGSMTSAAKALHIPIRYFRKSARGSHTLPRHVTPVPIGISEKALNTISDGATMLLEMDETERAGLFPQKYPLPLIKDDYIKKVESWKQSLIEKAEEETIGFQGFPIVAAYELLEEYIKAHEFLTKPNRPVSKVPRDRGSVKLLIGNIHHCLQRAILFKAQFEEGSNIFEIYSIALGIIHEYETYCLHRCLIKKHVKAQRKIVDSRRDEFQLALEKRDGLICKGCGRTKNLHIDHKQALSRGGLSVLENLQFLCSFCNNSKHNRPMSYLEKRLKRRSEAATQ